MVLARAILRNSTDKGRSGHIPAGLGRPPRSRLGPVAMLILCSKRDFLSYVPSAWLSWVMG